MTVPSGASSLGLAVVAFSTALVIVALAILPFLSPAWVAFEQGRAEAQARTGLSPMDLRTVTNAILGDLVLGPPAFDVALADVPVLSEAERSHMRDVRSVFAAFFAAAVAALAIVGAAFLLGSPGRASWTRRDAWRGVRFGAFGLAATIAVAGVVILVAFDAAFEAFHRVFFAQGTYLFDPRTDRLVQLFPEVFWSETAAAVGLVALGLALGAAWLGGRRLRASGRAA